MSRSWPKIPRQLQHRDIADLLKCLPDRKFPYRIFDAASGRVLQSVSGESEPQGTEDAAEQDVWRIEPDSAPAPSSEPVVLTHMVADTPRLETEASGAATLPRISLAAAPSRERTVDASLVRAPVPPAVSAGATAGLRRAATGVSRSAAAMLAGLSEPRSKPRSVAIASERSVAGMLGRLSRPPQPGRRTSRGSVSDALRVLGGALEGSRVPAPAVSARLVLRRLTERHGISAVAPERSAAKGSTAAVLGALGR